MVVVKVIRDSNGGLDYLNNVCNYVCDSRAIACDGYGVDASDPVTAFEQMAAMRRYYSQASTNPLLHLVVSLDDPCNTRDFAVEAAPQIGEYFKGQNQVMWCVHKADHVDAHYHIHYLVNTVNLNNGKLLQNSYKEMGAFAAHVKDVTGEPYQLYYTSKKQKEQL